MHEMNAAAFFRAFRSALAEDNVRDGRSYFDVYRHDEKAFTKLVNQEVVHRIIEEAGFTAQHEYFRIDTLGWSGRYEELDKTMARSHRLNRHLWDLEIVVEHENDKQDWLDEVIKLVHIRCPLKVVIGYNYCDQREEGERGKLQYAADCMNRVKAFDNAAEEEFLIILGNGVPQNSKSPMYTTFDYRGYLCAPAQKAFVEIS